MSVSTYISACSTSGWRSRNASMSASIASCSPPTSRISRTSGPILGRSSTRSTPTSRRMISARSGPATPSSSSSSVTDAGPRKRRACVDGSLVQGVRQENSASVRLRSCVRPVCCGACRWPRWVPRSTPKRKRDLAGRHPTRVLWIVGSTDQHLSLKPCTRGRRAIRQPPAVAGSRHRSPSWPTQGGPSCWPKPPPDRKSTRLNSSHLVISYAVFCLKKKKKQELYKQLEKTKKKKNKKNI